MTGSAGLSVTWCVSSLTVLWESIVSHDFDVEPMPTVHSLVTVMRFLVKVPVLSLQITLTDPRVSTLGRRRIIAFSSAIRSTPSANVTVTIIGNPSGIAATANDTPIWNMSNHERPWITPIKQIIPMTPKLIKESSLPSLSMEICNGVLGLSISAIISNTLPNSVL
ncbi:unintegrated signal peptide [Sugiyamaella lignohabitans]|uniref:Unintegrated signal peptide n=1 Tax=Sugiyamaella lignohabitans TaxID=796027 RepID=A0A167ETC9_9ASCO|nr:unintegrated signal peptide [Sugiyamaella lignohabitans]ANB14428.1 unintegrated signal peptide [Sugiyamaella lignohabitans]